MTASQKPSWYDVACAINYSPECYWYAVEGEIASHRHGGLAHRIACDQNGSEPYYPEQPELEKLGVDIELLARQLYDGIDPSLFGKALAAEGTASRINTVFKAGTVAEVNRWMKMIADRAAEKTATI